MGWPLSDITLYIPVQHPVGTPDYLQEMALRNYVSDLYMQKMNGYKPPKTSRINILPRYHDKWKEPHKIGSILEIASYFNNDEFLVKDKKGKYLCLLDLIQRATTEATEKYGWDKTVFENAYKAVLDSDFIFRKEYPLKQSRDRKKKGRLIIEKTELITSVGVEIEMNNSIVVKKLFDKANQWCYDSMYIVARSNKWLNNDRFGFSFDKGLIESWYSIDHDKVILMEEGELVDKITFGKYFMFESRENV